MAKKYRRAKDGIVFSTDPDFSFEETEEEILTLAPEKQKLKVLIDRKQRKGKTVTLITGFIGNIDDLKDLEKKLKILCGAGGSIKDGEILIQGNFQEKIFDFLSKSAYNVKKVGA